jgi:LPS-assembly protein
MGQDIADWKNAESSGQAGASIRDAISHRTPDVLPCRLVGTQQALMTVRNRFLITALMLCHLLVWPCLVTSQLRPAQPVATEEVTIEADKQEKIGETYHLHGRVHVHFREFDIHADEITYDQATGDITAIGHLIFDGGPNDLHIEGSRATYNSRTGKGKFYDVVGTTGAKIRGKHVLLTSSNPFAFSGRIVEKVAKDRIIVNEGTVTSCTLKDPKWTFKAQKIDVVLGQNAKLYHSTFRLRKIPIFYFPFATLPVEKIGRQSGFLIPSIGQSSRKGTIIGDSVYWAINRSMDATLGAEYWSSRGWAQHGDFRAKPTASSFLNFKYFGVLDRGFGDPKQFQGGEEATLNGEAALPHGIRGVASIDYLSSYVFRLAFSETFTQAVNSEVKSNAFLSKSSDGYSFNVQTSRYQNYQSTTPGDVITILHAPSADLNSVDRQIGSSPVYASYDIALQGVSRREPGFVTDNLVGRFDIHPQVGVPFHIGDWDFRPELGLRDTYYTQRLVPSTSGALVTGNQPVNRKALETTFEIRPAALSKMFAKPIFNHKVKHVIEPRVIYRYVNGVDNFSNIIRFDSRDILSDTNEVEYGVVNRFFTKRNTGEKCGNPDILAQELTTSTPGQAPPSPTQRASQNTCGVGVREVVNWEVVQKYFINESFGGALVPGQRNVFTTTVELTGISFLTNFRHFSPIVSRLRIKTAKDTDIEWHLDYDTVLQRINASTALVTHHIGDYFVGGSQAFLETPSATNAVTTGAAAPPQRFNQLRWLVGYGSPSKGGLSAAGNVGYDVSSRFLQYAAAQISYNWDCCGFSVEYRRLALGSVRNENQFRFALSLTNLGTFGTLRRQERLF